MKKYISVNGKYYTKNQLLRIINHNLRLQKIDYLLKDEDIKWDNINIIFDSFKDDNINDLILDNDTNKIDFKNLFLNKYQDMVKLRKEKNEQKGYFGNKEKNDLFEMVVSLSEEQTLNYLKNGRKEDIDKAFYLFAYEVKERFGFEPLMLSTHYDEGFSKLELKDTKKSDKELYEIIKKCKYNIHSQITFFNYDFDKNRSVLRTLTKKDFKELQDLASKVFKSLDLDYDRGISKKITNNEHLNVLEYKEQQLIKHILKYQDLKKLIKNNFENNKKDFKELENKMNLEIINKSENITELENMLNNLKDNIKEETKNYDNVIKEVNRVKNEFKEEVKEFDKIKNNKNSVKSDYDLIVNQFNEKKEKLNQLIRIEQNLRKNQKNRKEKVKILEDKFINLQKLDKDKTTKQSEKIDRIKEIYLSCVPLLGFGFNNDKYNDLMMKEFDSFINVNIDNNNLKDKLISKDNEIKALKQDIKRLENSDQNKKINELSDLVLEKEGLLGIFKEEVQKQKNKVEELRDFEYDNKKLKEEVKEKDKIINEKDQKIEDLKLIIDKLKNPDKYKNKNINSFDR